MIFSHVLYQLSYPATRDTRPTTGCHRLQADRSGHEY